MEHRTKGRQFIYRPAIAETDVRKEHGGRPGDSGCSGGDSTALVNHLVRSGEIDPDDLDDLRGDGVNEAEGDGEMTVWLVAFLVHGTLWCGVAWLFLRLFPKARARVRETIWHTAIAASLITPTVHSLTSPDSAVWRAPGAHVHRWRGARGRRGPGPQGRGGFGRTARKRGGPRRGGARGGCVRFGLAGLRGRYRVGCVRRWTARLLHPPAGEVAAAPWRPRAGHGSAGLASAGDARLQGGPATRRRG